MYFFYFCNTKQNLFQVSFHFVLQYIFKLLYCITIIVRVKIPFFSLIHMYLMYIFLTLKTFFIFRLMQTSTI